MLLALTLCERQREVKNMAITRWDPFSLPSLFDEYFESANSRGLKIRETDKDIVVEAVVAGIPAKNVEIHIEDGVLTIKAEAQKEDKENRASYQYYYTAALSGGAWDKADADIENGVVTISIPKQESARPRKITVKEKKSE